MAASRFSFLLLLLAAVSSTDAYWLMGMKNFITTERMDPIVSPGQVSGHVHSILGGSNFGFKTTTEQLRKSECTSAPIPQDKSNYWFPHLYFQWANGSFSSLTGGAVIPVFIYANHTDYLFPDDPGNTTAFPDDFHMLSGDPTLRSYNASSYAQQAISFLCLDFNGVSTRHNELPIGVSCPSGIRAQVNLPSCWDGKNLDSPDHKSHTAFPSGGPDSGTCKDPKFPVTLPRILIEVYWGANDFESHRSEAKNTTQPFVFAYGDATGYGYHADFINGWDKGVLQNAIQKCHCNPYGDPTCCADAKIFDFEKNGKQCHITPQVNEVATGMLAKLPGNNPLQTPADLVNDHVKMFPDENPPDILSPVTVYVDSPPAGACTVGKDIGAKCTHSPAPKAAAASTNTTSAVSDPKKRFAKFSGHAIKARSFGADFH